MKSKRIKTQSLAEASVLLTLAVAVVLGMQVYIKRSLQARYKSSVDTAVNMASSVVGVSLEDSLKQYEPYYQKMTSNSTMKYLDSDSAEGSGSGQKIINSRHSQYKSRISSSEGVDFNEDEVWE